MYSVGHYLVSAEKLKAKFKAGTYGTLDFARVGVG